MCHDYAAIPISEIERKDTKKIAHTQIYERKRRRKAGNTRQLDGRIQRRGAKWADRADGERMNERRQLDACNTKKKR